MTNYQIIGIESELSKIWCQKSFNESDWIWVVFFKSDFEEKFFLFSFIRIKSKIKFWQKIKNIECPKSISNTLLLKILLTIKCSSFIRMNVRKWKLEIYR